MVIGHEKGSDTESRIKHNFGMARPEGYRKAVRLMDLADKFGLPVLTLVDTAGAYPGIGAEERGQAEAIARSTDRCLSLGVPLVAVIIGEGGSGGAVAIATANRVLMLEHAIYTVASPEAAASILWRDAARAIDAATSMKITAQDLKALGVIDVIITEPVGGAHRDTAAIFKRAGDAIANAYRRVRRHEPRGDPPPAPRQVPRHRPQSLSAFALAASRKQRLSSPRSGRYFRSPMRPIAGKPLVLDKARARRIWLHAQRLDAPMPFGDGPEATRAAVEHLGYVQIDTINVIERCHHHILFTRIPGYQRAHLRHAQSVDKTVFEFWTHALSYVPTRDIRFFLGAMRRQEHLPGRWFGEVTQRDLRKVLTLIKRGGPLTIRDIDDDVLVEKNHPWASRKPSKRALQVAFYKGAVTVSERVGMLKTYELMDRHFGWDARPRPASERQIVDYLLDAGAARARARERRFRLPSRRQAQGGGPPPDRSGRAPQAAGAGRARGRGKERALGAARDPRYRGRAG